MGLDVEANEGRTVQAERAGEPWSRTDELNWAADKTVLRELRKRGERPSEWLAKEYRELSARRKAVAARG